MTLALQADARRTNSKGELKRLRRQGKIPAVVYGDKVGNVPVTVDERQLHPIISKNARSILQMEIEGAGTHSVIINELQRDPVTNHLLHIDFWQIRMDEKIRTFVRLDLVGTPVGVKEGGVKTVLEEEVEVECLPADLPEAIQVNIEHLGIGDSLTVADITSPDKVAILTNPEEVIVTISAQQKLTEAAPEDGEAEAADSSAVESREE